MTKTVKDYALDIERSIYYFLNNEIYSGARTGSAGKTLKQHFTNPALNIILGWPDNLESLKLPALAIISGDAASEEQQGIGTELRECPYSFSIYGFCGGHQSDILCQKQRREMLNDVKGLLEQSEYIDFFEGGSFAVRDVDMAVEDVSGSYLAPTGPLESERYRFLVSFTVKFFKEN